MKASQRRRSSPVSKTPPIAVGAKPGPLAAVFRPQVSATRFHIDHRILWACIVVLGLARLVLFSDLHPPMSFGPHDTSLYVTRAYYLLMGEGFGPYNSYVLAKHPGISIWMFAVRAIGLPFLFSVNLVYVLAGVYVIEAARRCGMRNVALLAAYVLYLLNPISYSHVFLGAGRDGLQPSLMIALLGAMLFVISGLLRAKLKTVHLVVCSAVFAFLLILREEGVLLWFLLLTFSALAAYTVRHHFAWPSRQARIALLLIAAIPVASAAVTQLAVILMIRWKYGVALMNDFGSGEFPGFIAALRSACVERRTRYVSITQRGLRNIRDAVPALRFLIDKLPPPPDEHSMYYPRFRVAGEWTNSHFFFWIKDISYLTGLTPDLPRAQEFFARGRIAIEKACRDGRLRCAPDGSGLIPPARLAWAGDFVSEARQAAAYMLRPGTFAPAMVPPDSIVTLEPMPGLVGGPPDFYGTVQLGRIYQTVLMAPFDSLLQYYHSAPGIVPWQWHAHANLYAGLDYWMRNPDVACNREVGLLRNLSEEQIKGLVRTLGRHLAAGRNINNSPDVVAKTLAGLGMIESSELELWKRSYRVDILIALKYLLARPQEAVRLLDGQRLGARMHYDAFHEREARDWITDPKPPPVYRAPLARIRTWLPAIYRAGTPLIAVGLWALVVCLAFWRRRRPGPVVMMAACFVAYCIVQVLALGYISVTMGTLDARLYYANYVALFLFAPPLIADAIETLAAWWRGRARE